MQQRIYILFFILSSLTASVSRAQQNEIPLRYSQRDGTYLYFADRALAADAPFNTITAVRVSRNTGKGYALLTVVTRAKNVSEFKMLCGDTTWDDLKRLVNLSSDAELWKYIIAHPLMEDYGTLSFNMNFRRAMGSGLLDKAAAGLSLNTKWIYKIEMLDGRGAVVNTLEGSVLGGPGSLVLSKARTLKVEATDSLVMGSWYVIKKKPVAAIVLADVYRQTGGKGAYEKLTSSLLATAKADSLIFNLTDVVAPSTLYRYYIIPTDDIGNASQRSDTLNILSFDFRSLPLMSDVKATDTINGIRLTWKPLGDQPQVVGIEIQRSRDIRGNYVVIDTIHTQEAQYLDTQVFPDIPYFYRLRTLALAGMEKETGYTGYVTALMKNKQKNPDPPYGLKGKFVNGKIKLEWQGVNDADLYGYFVYRGVSETGRFDVISDGLKTTEFTDTSSVNGRTQFVYAVKAVNNNSLTSDFSNLITMRQNVMQLPREPAGANAYLRNHTVVLEWPSAVRTDYAVAGYMVYRREAQVKNTFDAKQSAAAQATLLKFTLLTNALVNQTVYEDNNVEAGKVYEYAVASVDVFGVESTYSPFAKIAINYPTRVVATCTVRKVSTGVALNWEDSFMQDAATLVIYRKKVGESSYQKTVALKKGSTQYIDKTAAKGILYTYLISAENGNVVLAKSEEKNIQY